MSDIPSISIVIPTRDSALGLLRLLSSIRTQSRAPQEVIVVDNHSTDRTLEIARGWGAQVHVTGPERSAQRNLGAASATGEFVLFVDSDMELAPGLVMECAKMADRLDAICVRELTATGGNIFARARALERESYFQSRYFEAARCIRRTTFFELGGYHEEITGTEDMDLQARLIKSSVRFGWARSPLVHHEEDVGLIQYLRKRMAYSRTDEIFAARDKEFWQTQRSVRQRVPYLFKGFSLRPTRELILLVPSLLVMRIFEYGWRIGRISLRRISRNPGT